MTDRAEVVVDKAHQILHEAFEKHRDPRLDECRWCIGVEWKARLHNYASAYHPLVSTGANQERFLGIPVLWVLGDEEISLMRKV
jgi:hypothetical protein